MNTLSTSHKSICRISRLMVIVIQLVFMFSCEEFVKIDPPRTDLIKANVFASDATANAGMINVYYQLALFSGFSSGGGSSVSYVSSLSSDEYTNYPGYSVAPLHEFSNNQLTPNNSFVLALWSDMYKTIYQANAIVEGLSNAPGVTDSLKNQLEGEAKFVRAFVHFYLVNLFGEVPLVTSTDYRSNAVAPRTSRQEIYQQMIVDLKEAQNLLSEDYSFSNGERVRANKGAATALLARVYLYNEDWSNAEAEATRVIEQDSQYGLKSDPALVFKSNSMEAILQYHTVNRPRDFSTFRVFTTGPSQGAFREGFVSKFEVGDLRLVKWVRSIVANGVTYFYPGKYRATTLQEEYSTVLRLAEQYLIRSEARAQQGNVSGAQEDLNIIRNRAGLANSVAGDKIALLAAIEQERAVELFTEHGHRWLDLKRTNRVNDIMSLVNPGNWQSSDTMYPIPEYQILNDPAMTNSQNPGY